MPKLQVSIAVQMPEHRDMAPAEHQGPSVEDEVKHALDCIDSGNGSRVEWGTVTRLYTALKNLKKKSSRAKNLMSMIEPVMAKYGYHKVDAVPEDRK